MCIDNELLLGSGKYFSKIRQHKYLTTSWPQLYKYIDLCRCFSFWSIQIKLKGSLLLVKLFFQKLIMSKIFSFPSPISHRLFNLKIWFKLQTTEIWPWYTSQNLWRNMRIPHRFHFRRSTFFFFNSFFKSVS